MGLTAGDADPLAHVLRPPEDETADQKSSRLRAEADAKRRSDEIDSMLAAEAATLKKRRKKEIRILLLGQSESGKSTTLKNFQLAYAQQAWAVEKTAWRTVIQLNVVRSVNRIVAALERELNDNSSVDSDSGDGDDLEFDNDASSATDETPSLIARPPTPGLTALANALSGRSTELSALIERLRPLQAVQTTLERALGREGEDEQVHSAPQAVTNGFGIPSSPKPLKRRKSHEFFVRSTNWKDTLQRFQSQLRTRYSIGSANDAPGDMRKDQISAKLSNCSNDIALLWKDPAVRQIVGRMKEGLGDEAEFFLGDVARVTEYTYAPTDDDVIRARLRTMGVQEHRILMESGAFTGREWVIYDVGGSRSQRTQWAAYFQSVHAIIFLAPLSCFNQHLPEDPRVNRLDDTIQLWKQVVANKLLKKTDLIVFFNKQDLLERKLASGVKFSSWVRNYKGPEDAESVSRFVKAKFQDTFRVSQRPLSGLHVFLTSVVDTKATMQTLVAVQDGILRRHLTDLDLI